MGSQFWASPLSDPKRLYRFNVIFGDFEPWLATTVTLPAFKLGEAKHSYLNHTFKYPGRIEWQDVTLGLRDPALPDTADDVMRLLRAAGYKFPDAQFANNTQETVSKAGAIGVIGQNSVKIQQLDGFGNPITTWILKNAWIKEVKPSDLDYSKDDLTEIKITITYDWAEIESTPPQLPTII